MVWQLIGNDSALGLMLHLAHDHKEIGIQPYQPLCWDAVTCGERFLVLVVLEVYVASYSGFLAYSLRPEPG